MKQISTLIQLHETPFWHKISSKFLENGSKLGKITFFFAMTTIQLSMIIWGSQLPISNVFDI